MKFNQYVVKNLVLGLAFTSTLGSLSSAKADGAEKFQEQSENQEMTQIDSMFESQDHRQLKADEQFLAAEAVRTEKTVNKQKTKTAALKAKNERLGQQISKESQKLKRHQRALAEQERVTEKLETQVAAKEKWLEKVRIKAIEIRKKQEALRKKQIALKAKNTKMARIISKGHRG